MAQTQKTLEKYLVQLRRIEEHRELNCERNVRRIYKDLLKDLQNFLGSEYAQLAEDDKLTYEILQGKGEYARFLEQVQVSINKLSPKIQQEITQTVEETYKAAYEGMVTAVKKSSDIPQLHKNLAGLGGTTPEIIKRVVENPITGLTLNDRLEKNRRDVIYNIKQQIGIGLTQGDRYSTMARRISEQLDMGYNKAIRIVRTETHRVREAGNHDAAMDVDGALKNGTTGMRMVKVWKTMKDERVRPQVLRKTKKGWVKSSSKNGADHVKMEGQTVLEDEPFDLGGGVTAMAPGQSGDAKNDINCRCYASREMMTDEEYFKATGKHFPAE